MRKDPSNPKYIKVEVIIGPIVKEVIRIEMVGQTVESEDNMEIIGQEKAIETIILERTLGDVKDKRVEENIGIMGAMTITGLEIDQEKGHSQEISVMIGIEVPVTVGQGLDLELVLIEIGQDVTIVGNMTIFEKLSQLQRRKRPRAITTNAEHGSQGTNSFVDQQTRQPHRKLQKSFTLMNGRDGTSAFLPLDSRIGGQGRNNHPTVGQFLTREQTRYIYRKEETGEVINIDMIEQEIEQEKQLNRIDDTSGETSTYKEHIVNNVEKIEPLMTEMEQWSILSNVLIYVQHSRFHSMNHTLVVKAVNKYKHKPNTDNREFKELDFGTMPQQLQEEYMDIYEGFNSDIVRSNRLDENSYLNTTYLARVDKRNQQLKAEESFPISEHGYTSGKLLDGTECHLLLDTGTSKSFMSKSFYMQCQSLHSLRTVASKTQRIRVGNSQCVSVLFIIPVIIDIHGHRFKIYTLVSEIHKNVDLVLGIKNVFELEGVINSRDCCFKFLNRSVPIYPEKEIILKHNEQKFTDEISRMAIKKNIRWRCL